MTLSPQTAHLTSDAHLQVLEICYRWAYLNGRRSAGIGLTEEEQAQLEALERFLEEQPTIRRKHRRFPTALQAVVKTPNGLARGVVLDLSGCGMFVALEQDVPAGATVQVKVGRAGEVEYLFTCTVVRSGEHRGLVGLGLSYCCVPLEMRRARPN